VNFDAKIAIDIKKSFPRRFLYKKMYIFVFSTEYRQKTPKA